MSVLQDDFHVLIGDYDGAADLDAGTQPIGTFLELSLGNVNAFLGQDRDPFSWSFCLVEDRHRLLLQWLEGSGEDVEDLD